MTDLHNSNGDDKRPSDDATPSGDTPEPLDGDLDNLDDAWSAFESSHEDELNALAHSRSARHFEKHAERKDRESLLSVDDLATGTFTDDPATHHSQARRPDGRPVGPRDITNSSWLDTDDVLDRSGDDFVPPHPTIGPVQASTLTFWLLLVVGVLGVILTVFLPSLAAILGTVFGVCVLIGGAGLIVQHRDHADHADHDDDSFPDGARI